MHKTIFLNSIKRGWKLVLVFLLLLCFYQAVIISLIDPADMGQIQALFGTMESFMGAFSISIASMTSPLTYTASVFFSLLVMAFTMVFYVIEAHNLIAKQVEDTSIGYTLSAPVSRAALVFTQGVYLIFSMFILFFGIFLSGAFMLSTKGDVDILSYLNLVCVTCLLSTAVAMLSYFLSVAFCGSSLSIRLSAGVPIGLLFLCMLGGAGGEKTKWLQHLSPFGWIDSVGIVTGQVDTFPLYLVFGGTIVVLLLSSVIVFRKKQLSI